MERQATERENTFANDTSKIYQIQYQKNNSIKKWVKDLKKHFSKDDIQMDKTHEEMPNVSNHQRCKLKPQ